MAQANTYIAEGFMHDCEDLIHTLTNKYKTVDWHKFCDQWKEKRFDTLFYGRQSGAEVVEFTEEALQCARLYLVTETDNYEEQVVGLFIVYALLTIQPYKKLCPFRLVPEDVEPVIKFKNIAKQEGRKDVLMILGKVLIYGPTQFHICVRERAMDVYLRKYFDGSTNTPFCILRRWHGILSRDTLKGFRQIDSLEVMYAGMKEEAKRTCQSIFPDKKVEVDMAKNVGKEMADSLQNLISGVSMNMMSEDEDLNYASSVKRNAMKRLVNPMRHLHGLDERKRGPQAHVVPLTPVKKKSKFKKEPTRMSSPKPLEDTEQPFRGFSLPGIEELCRNDDDLPEDETPFRGFSKSALETLEEDVLTRVKAETVKSKAFVHTDQLNRKRKGETIEENESDDAALADKVQSSWMLANGISPRMKRDTDMVPVKKRIKKPIKNEHNRKIRLFEFTSDDSDAIDDSFEIEDESEITSPTPPPPSPPPQKVYQARKSIAKRQNKKPLTVDKHMTRELKIQSKGQVQHYIDVQVKDMPIVIRTEKETHPFEIEIIDNYETNKTNHLYEEVCEVSDDEENRKADVRKEPAYNIDLTRDDNAERCHFEIISYDDDVSQTETAGRQRDMFAIDEFLNTAEKEKIIDETVQRVLTNERQPMERKKLKRRILKSKLKKMGILPVANFEDDSD